MISKTSKETPVAIIWVLLPLVYIYQNIYSTLCFISVVALYAVIEHLRRVEKRLSKEQDEEIKKIKEKVEILSTLPVFLGGKK